MLWKAAALRKSSARRAQIGGKERDDTQRYEVGCHGIRWRILEVRKWTTVSASGAPLGEDVRDSDFGGAPHGGNVRRREVLERAQTIRKKIR